MIFIFNPQSIDRFVAHETTPILAPHHFILVTNGDFIFPQRPVVTEGTDVTVLILLNGMVNICNFQVINSPCRGNICDHQSIMNEDMMKKKCCCIHMMNHIGTVVILFHV